MKKTSEELREILDLADTIPYFWYYDCVDGEYNVIKDRLRTLQKRLEDEE